MTRQATSDMDLVNVVMLHRANVSVRPRDSSGKYLGPGHASQIAIQICAGHLIGSLEDKLDGTYDQVIEYSSGQTPNVSVSIADGPSETVSVPKQCWLCQLIKWLCNS